MIILVIESVLEEFAGGDEGRDDLDGKAVGLGVGVVMWPLGGGGMCEFGSCGVGWTYGDREEGHWDFAIHAVESLC